MIGYNDSKYMRSQARVHIKEPLMSLATLGAVKAVDIVFYVLLALAFAGGLFGGLKRAFKGFYIGVITVLAAMLLTSATIVPVRKLDVCQDLTSSLESSGV